MSKRDKWKGKPLQDQTVRTTDAHGHTTRTPTRGDYKSAMEALCEERRKVETLRTALAERDEALIRLHAWAHGTGWDAKTAHDVHAWIEAGMVGPLPKLCHPMLEGHVEATRSRVLRIPQDGRGEGRD